MLSTRDRVVASLAELAAESDGGGFGAMLQGMYAFGFDSAIAAAIPDDDLQADVMLEQFALIALCLRSERRRELVPFDPPQGALLEPVDVDDQVHELEADPSPAGVVDVDELDPDAGELAQVIDLPERADYRDPS